MSNEKFIKKRKHKAETKAKKQAKAEALEAQKQAKAKEQIKITRVSPIEKPIDNDVLKNLQSKPSVPYNFVRLAPQVIPAEFYTTNGDEANVENYKTHVKQSDNVSGYIDLSITTKTPLFIGGETVDKGNGLHQEFYGGDDNPTIPGSSLKGMLKQIFKIVTASTFRPFEDGSGDFEDRKLYFRNFTRNPLRDYYNDRMTSPNPKNKKKPFRTAIPGFLIKTSTNEYYIVKGESEMVPYSNDDRYNGKDVQKDIVWHETFVEIHTGPTIGKKKKKEYVTILKPNFKPENRISVPIECIHSYEDDVSRNTINLLGRYKPDGGFGKYDDEAAQFTGYEDIISVIPCHYALQKDKTEDKIAHFGHGQLYRISYDLSIGDHIPKTIKDKNDIVDLSDSVFGFSDKWAGRLSFTDGRLVEDHGRHRFGAYTKPLLSPKPTSFQFYLNQDFNESDKLNHWGIGDVSIRGYKMYWHQPLINAVNWQCNEEPLENAKTICPVYEGNVFNSRIYFDRLTRIELGALLFVLNLDKEAKKEICYKLGMGKSIGLGSIKLENKVTIINSKERYSSMFEDKTWKTGESPLKDSSAFIDAFVTYRDGELGSKKENYETMLSDLYSLMDWSLAKDPEYSTYWPYATKMMSIDDSNDENKHFVNRTKLDRPSAFIKHWCQKEC